MATGDRLGRVPTLDSTPPALKILPLAMSANGTKRTIDFAIAISVFDPKRSFAEATLPRFYSLFVFRRLWRRNPQWACEM